MIYEFCYWLGASYLTSLLGSLQIVFMAIRNSHLLHFQIIKKLLHASFPRFYNLILTGRLMNRLSKDIYYVDYYLPQYLNSSIIEMSMTLGPALIFIFSVNYIFIILNTANILILTLLLYVFVLSSRELTRIGIFLSFF